MTLKNKGAKEAALSMSKKGMKTTDIAKEVGLSKATLKRLFKKNGVTKIKSETLPNKDTVEGNHTGEPIKTELEGSKNEGSNIKEGIESEPKGATGATVTKVTYNKDGSFSIEKVKLDTGKDLMRENKQEPTKNNSRSEIAGGGQQFKEAPETRKRDIDEPDNPIDDLFSRKIVSTLVPLGLILSGYLLKGDKSDMPLQPINAGENIRKRVQGWLGEGGKDSDW